jgi:hypothetical protein
MDGGESDSVESPSIQKRPDLSKDLSNQSNLSQCFMSVQISRDLSLTNQNREFTNFIGL